MPIKSHFSYERLAKGHKYICTASETECPDFDPFEHGCPGHYYEENERALSVRQPWAWLIVNGYKDIENRSWKTTFRGRVFIHASKKMTKQEYKFACDYVRNIDPSINIPLYSELQRGGIIGAVDVVDCIKESESPWFMGEHGFVLENPKTVDFIPYKGQLGFFKVDYKE